MYDRCGGYPSETKREDSFYYRNSGSVGGGGSGFGFKCGFGFGSGSGSGMKTITHFVNVSGSINQSTNTCGWGTGITVCSGNYPKISHMMNCGG